MSYLGRRGALAPLTSADIPAGIVEGTDVAFLENSSGQTLAGTYSTERMYLSGRTGSAPNDYNYKLEGDVTVTGHLALGSIADEDIVITNDGTERTITTDASGGTLEAGNVLQDTHRTDLTGMTGELGSVVTGSPNLNLTTGTLGSGVTFPAGHIINTYQINQAGGLSNSSTTATIIPGLTKTLTPVSSSSKFLFIVTASGHLDSGTDTAHEIDLFYGGVSLGPKLAVLSSIFGVTYNNLSNSLSFTFLHAPATTSSITYDVRGRVYFGTGNMYWYQGAGHMTIMEIAS